MHFQECVGRLWLLVLLVAIFQGSFCLAEEGNNLTEEGPGFFVKIFLGIIQTLVGCKADEGCFADPEKPFCSDNRCYGGCRVDEDCDCFDEVCNVPGYDNCNYCDAADSLSIGTCSPGCAEDSNCAGEDVTCNAENECGCTEDSECQGTICSTCSLETNICSNPECCSNDECTDSACSYCVSDTCVNPECCTDNDCSDTPCSTCVSDTCVNPDCCSNDDCNNICFLGFCVL